MTSRGKRIALVFAAAATLQGLAGMNARAQDALPTPTQSTEAFQDWSVECSTIQPPAADAAAGTTPEASKAPVKRICEAVQIYRNSKTGNEFARLAFAYDQSQEAKKLVSGMRLLVDVSFESAPEILIEEQVLMAGKIARCIDQFCYAEFTVDATSLAKLKDAPKASVRYPIGNGKKINIAISSKGLAEALSTIEKR